MIDIDIRRTSVYLTCLAILACGPATVPADEAGSTTNPGESETGTSTETDASTETDTGSETVCGDGVIDPGEACDDANFADDDGCTANCEIGPCGFEWVLREPSITVDRFAGIDFVDGALEATTAHWGLEPAVTEVTRITASDGAIEATLDLSGVIGNEALGALVLGPGGDRFAAADAMSIDSRVLRLSPTLEVLWDVVVPNTGDFVGLASAAGQLAILGSIEVDDSNRDATVLSLDPDDGSVLWSYNLSGQVAENGYSLDAGTTLTIDSDGRLFVGIIEYLAWDTTAATIAAFAPDGGDPLWSTRAVEIAGERLGAQQLAIGPDGTVYLAAQSWDDYFESYLVALAPETGTIEWIFDYDNLPIDRTWATALGVAVSTDRVLTTGYWSYFDGNQQVVQAYALGFDLAGTRVCIGTYDTYPPRNLDELLSWAPFAAVAGSRGEFYLGGIVLPYFDDNTNELFVARVR